MRDYERVKKISLGQKTISFYERKPSLGQNLHEKSSSSPTCIHMAFTLVPHFSCMDFTHKVYFSCMDFMHKIYFSCMDSSNQLWPAIDPCVSTEQPNRPVRKTSEIPCTWVCPKRVHARTSETPTPFIHTIIMNILCATH